ncbi:phenylalanine--tRNA ligase subunit beta [Nocardioides sp. Root190]|uniref:phenylalanine--tRNA ligase subunit beta n=1 Tax=Nocardioides sp. Root190 TaxID=1736488 RepID=UPI0006F37BB3|nr:phenylalanine--tRNA ligase subunit beta [Nocardioides sp. Root190]KRB75775.1 phenylalanine--tRNA ligase subunit beta [Nocardioides sp. Root190]
MKAPVSWIRELVELPADVTTEALTDRLTALGLKLEGIQSAGADLQGPLVVGKVLTKDPEPQKNGKVINWCTVDVGDANGTGEPQGIVCGAHNFEPGDLVVVVLPGGVLPGGFEISARKTYGHVSSGMICSVSELGIGEDHDGILVLPADAGRPGDDVFSLLGLDEEIIEFEINPDRAYALSLRGVAREAALGFGVPFLDPAEREVPAVDGAAWQVDVEDTVGCPVFAARLVSGFDPARPTPEVIKQRVEQAGMRSISLAVDITNYVMLELGQPIHGYDADKVVGALGVRRARDGERVTTLDDTDRELSTEDLVITDDSGPIGLAGVMGGATTEMSEATTRILIEAAHWDATSMFRTGKRHRLSSEAGKRNERGVDPLLPGVAADRVVELLVEHGGATAEPGFTLVGTAPQRPTITIETGLPARLSGIDISAMTTVEHLRAIGATVTEHESGAVEVVPPSWRPDVNEPYDLVEEVVRIVGYDQVPSILPRRATGRGLTRTQRLRRRIGRTLAGSGLVEVVSFPFVGEASFDKLGLAADDPLRTTVGLANPLSSEEPSYTTTLLPGLLEAAGRNIGRGATGVALFETGTVAFPSDSGPAPIYGVHTRPSEAELEKLFESLPIQPQHLAVVLAGERTRPGWWGAGADAAWSDALAVVRRLAGELGVTVQVTGAARMPWHPGRCAVISIDGVEIGHAGELHPGVCTSFGLPKRSAAVEIDLDALIAASVDVTPGPVFSTMPLAKEDVALVVDAAVPAALVEAALREGAGELLESVRLFDVYVGEQIEEGRKSLAFALRFRAPDRTLTDAETGAARDAAVAAAAERTGAVQR